MSFPVKIRRGPNYPLFLFGLLLAIAVGLAIVPGLDFVAWHFLRPTGFWRKAILIGFEWITLWPRVILVFLFSGGIAAFFAAVSE